MIKSPCIKDCNFDEKTQTCKGCLRTIDEFKNWRGMSNEEKLEVLDRISREKNDLQITSREENKI